MHDAKVGHGLQEEEIRPGEKPKASKNSYKNKSQREESPRSLLAL